MGSTHKITASHALVNNKQDICLLEGTGMCGLDAGASRSTVRCRASNPACRAKYAGPTYILRLLLLVVGEGTGAGDRLVQGTKHVVHVVQVLLTLQQARHTCEDKEDATHTQARDTYAMNRKR